MKFLIATSGNVFHGFTEDGMKLEPAIELVITTSEKTLQPIGGALVRASSFQDCRIGLTIESAKSLMDSLDEFMTEAERQAEKIEVKCD
jgi:hypothetical protein